MTQRRLIVPGPAISRRLLLGGAAAASVLSACSSRSTATQPANPDAAVTLTWWTGQADEAQKILTELAAEFSKLHPNVTIEVSPGAPSTEDLLQKLSSSFAGGTYPDVSYAFGSWASELADSGRTLDITSKVAERREAWEQFPSAARATATPGGKTIGFPSVVDNLTLLYNTALFESAGVPVPTESWTWDDFRVAAKKLTNPGAKVYGYAYGVSGSEETTWQFWPHLWQRGGAILDSSSKRAVFDSAEGVAALEFLRSMAVDDKSVYLDQTDTKFTQLFASGQIGMVTSGPWVLHDLHEVGTAYGVTTLPAFQGKHTTISGADLWVLFDHKDANRAHWAYEFVSWLTDPAQDVRWNVEYGNLPLRESEVSSPEFKAQQAELPGLEVMARNSANATIPRPTVKGYVGLSEAIGAAISEVLQGQGDAKSRLKEAAEKATQALAD